MAFSVQMELDALLSYIQDSEQTERKISADEKQVATLLIENFSKILDVKADSVMYSEIAKLLKTFCKKGEESDAHYSEIFNLGKKSNSEELALTLVNAAKFIRGVLDNDLKDTLLKSADLSESFRVGAREYALDLSQRFNRMLSKQNTLIMHSAMLEDIAAMMKGERLDIKEHKGYNLFKKAFYGQSS